MIKLTPKAKKVTTISSIAAVCICALISILYQNANAVNKNLSDVSSSVSSSVSSEAPASAASVSGAKVLSVSSGIAGTGSAVVPKKGESSSAPLTITKKSVSTPKKPVIHGDSKNGKQPTNGTLTNRSERPTYKTPPKAPATHHSSYSGSGTTQKNSGGTTAQKHSGGSTTGTKGSGYDPIFGNSYGTGGQGTTVGNKNDDLGATVGIMD